MGRANRDYDRTRLLAAAREAASRKRRRTAIRLYRRVLTMEPDNASLHEALAPLLARTRQPFDAWMSFRASARHALRENRCDRAFAIYEEASCLLPLCFAVWTEWAEVLRRRQRGGEAIDVLQRGATTFSKRRRTPEAVHLLRLARRIEPWRTDLVLALCRALQRSGQCDEARVLLSELPQHVHRQERLRVLRAGFALHPTWRGAAAMVREQFASSRLRTV